MMISIKPGVVLLVGVSLTLLPARAQTYTPIHQFAPTFQNSSTGLYTNADGGNPYAPLLLSGSTLYGAAAGYDTGGVGGLFKINTDGTGFTNFISFSTSGGGGVNPSGGLILSGGVLYGTTKNGGTNFTGSLFAVKTDGIGITNLYGFHKLVSNKNADGSYPSAALTLSGGVLYGTTYSGGTFGAGTIFRVGIDGTGFTNLHNFDGTNGANSYGSLAVSGGRLYGTTFSGGAATNGVIFGIGTDGTGFTNLHSFSALGYPYTTNLDGANPQAGLVVSGNTLYGLASRGGMNGSGYGTLFAISTDGSLFTNLFSFNFTGGGAPYSDLLLVNNTFYGTCTSGGSNFAGSVFKINADGTGFVDLYDFPTVGYNGSSYTNSTGAEPWAGVVMAGNALFGVTPTGGTGGSGTVFSLVLGSSGLTEPIPLDVQASNGTITLSWSNPAFQLQATPAFGVPFTNVPNATSPYPVSPSKPQMFFRLQAN